MTRHAFLCDAVCTPFARDRGSRAATIGRRFVDKRMKERA